MFYPLIDVSIRFSPLLGFILNACGEGNIHFVLLYFVVVFFAVRNHDVFLNYMGTPQWVPHWDNFT